MEQGGPGASGGRTASGCMEETEGLEDNRSISADSVCGILSVYLVSGNVQSFTDSLLVYVSCTAGDIIRRAHVYSKYAERKFHGDSGEGKIRLLEIKQTSAVLTTADVFVGQNQ